MVQRVKRKSLDVDFLDQRLSRGQVARLLNTSPQRISQLEREGMIQPDADGRFVLCKFVQDYFRYIERRKSSARIDDDKKIRQLKIEQMERKAAQEAGDLLSTEAIKDWMLRDAGKLHADYISLPARFTRDRAEMKRLMTMIEDIHRNFCDAIHKEHAAIKAGNGTFTSKRRKVQA